MKKRVLVVTPVYPADDIPKTDTPVVHYFTREWVKMGYEVKVIHCVTNFPNIFYYLIKPFRDLIGSYEGYVIRDHPYVDKEYELEGVHVKRIAMTKMKPHSRYSKKVINATIFKIEKFCEINNFCPDVIIGHWLNPSIEIMPELKHKFHCLTCYVAHWTNKRTVYGDRLINYLNDIDVIGFRSIFIREQFLNVYKVKKPSFLCYSGIPSSYLDDTFSKDFSTIKDFIYVGTMIARKCPAQIIPALSNAFGQDPFTMLYIGTGEQLSKAKKNAIRYKVEQNVQFLGRQDRDVIINLLMKSQVFIMISIEETFGLVYLEAMAMGCITIASRNGGFDGIIKDGVNGFLCEEGNENELSDIIKHIRTMSEAELLIISKRAMETATELTDKRVAKNYIDSVFNTSK